MTATIQIEYAREAAESQPDRLLRRIVGWAAAVYGGTSLLQLTLHIGLATGRFARPPNMSWNLSGGWGIAQLGVQLLIDCCFLLAGALLLWRSALGIVLLRGAAITNVLILLVGLISNLREYPSYVSYWSKPATAVMEFLDLLAAVWVPLLIAALTLRRSGKRLT